MSQILRQLKKSKLVQNGNSGKDLISLWSKKKTLGPAEFPAFWCAPNWARRRFLPANEAPGLNSDVKCPALPIDNSCCICRQGTESDPWVYRFVILQIDWSLLEGSPHPEPSTQGFTRQLQKMDACSQNHGSKSAFWLNYPMAILKLSA